MAQHVFTLRLTAHISDPALKAGESGHTLTVTPEIMYQTLLSLRNNLFEDLDLMDAETFSSATQQSNTFNEALAQLEELGAIALSRDEDDES
jgi:hypothetical protein